MPNNLAQGKPPCMSTVSFGSYGSCVRMENSGTEMVVSTEFGPRILSFGSVGGKNVFFLFPDGKGPLGEDGYLLYGGHRLWIAPEVPAKTMQPDNSPVEVSAVGNGFKFTTPKDSNNVQKSVQIRTLPNGVWELTHSVQNLGAYDIDLALWALSMLDQGSIVVFPNAPFIPHTERVLPARPLVLWHYTSLGDSRWTWGKKLTRLQQSNELGPIKVGTFINQGYAAAQCADGLLVKRFEVSAEKSHLDMGCNFETFTNEEMIEIETLSAEVRLAPGESVTHAELWKFYPGETLPTDDEAAASKLAQLAAF